MSKRVLVTGGTGFIGHHLVDHLLMNTDWEFICLDRLDTSGTLYRLHDVLHGEKESHLFIMILNLKLIALLPIRLVK